MSEPVDNNLVEVEPNTWTTEDETNFIRELYHKRNLNALIQMQRTLPYRTFYGPRMHVDVNLVRMTLDTMISALEQELLG